MSKPEKPDIPHLLAIARGMPNPNGYTATEIRKSIAYIEYQERELKKSRKKECKHRGYDVRTPEEARMAMIAADKKVGAAKMHGGK